MPSASKPLTIPTLQFTLTKPAGYFLTITTLPLLSPVPGEIIEEFEEEWILPENLATSGPYMLISGDLSDTRTVLKEKMPPGHCPKVAMPKPSTSTFLKMNLASQNYGTLKI